MNLFLLLLFSFLIHSIDSMLITDDQIHEIAAARCYSKCLQIFIHFKSTFSMSQTGPENFTRSPVDVQGTRLASFVDDTAHQLLVTKQNILSCLNDTENSCSKQCIQSCSMVGDCICQPNDIGCMLACQFRKEINKESSSDECPTMSSLDETTMKNLNSQCPKNCKTKSDCHPNQLCCLVETCDMICLQIERRKMYYPKYKPVPTKLNTSVNIEFDWSQTFKPFLNKDSPLIFILQTRSCLCHKFNEKYATPWQTLIRTHRLRVELNTFDKGTIYQFRLAAVGHNGSDGFGLVSDNLPTVIPKPPLPLPPENIIDYKWQITDENKFRVEIKWKKSVDPFWRSYEFQVSWMVDHGVAQPDGEPLSSLTQYSKTLPGNEERCTIDGLKPATTYKVQIVVKVHWPSFGPITSIPSTMYITTPSTKDSSEFYLETITSNNKIKECSCPEKHANKKDFKIRSIHPSNRNLQAVIDMKIFSDYLVEGYPEACINAGSENLSKSIQRFRKIYKQTDQLILNNLRFHCRYSVDVTRILGNMPNSTYHMCFCTPPCSYNMQYPSKYCHKEDISIPSPKEPRSVLINLDTMTYEVSWKRSHRISPRNRLLGVSKYRISWAPRKFEPVNLEHYLEAKNFKPLIDLDQSDVKIVHSNVTLFRLHNLTKEQVYVIRIQSLGLTPNGEIIESFPATILLPTHGYSDNFYAKSSQNGHSIHSTLIIIIVLFHTIFTA